MSKVIAVANQKGGVAKTTTTGALAVGLKRKGFNVLLIDLDPQGNLSDSLGAINYDCPTMYELLKRELNVKTAVQKLAVCDIIPANILLAGAEQEISETGKEHRLRETLEVVSAEYDYIIIDTPPSLGILTVNAFTAANQILVPSTAGIFAAKGIVQLSRTIDNVKKYCNRELSISGILITKYNPRANISKDIKKITEQLSSQINAKVYNTFIRNSVTIEEAQATKTDIFSYAQSSTVAKDYETFVEEFLKGVGM
jgi:chromosome partitioning protein